MRIIYGQLFLPLTTGGSSAIDRTASNYNDAREKVKKIRGLIKTGKYDADIARYIPGTLDMVYQGMLEDRHKRKSHPHFL